MRNFKSLIEELRKKAKDDRFMDESREMFRVSANAVESMQNEINAPVKPVVKEPHMFPLSARQVLDLSAYVVRLNEAEKDLEAVKDPDWGEGHRIILGPIAIYTDAHGVKENLGWLEQDEFGWTFSQTRPKDCN